MYTTNTTYRDKPVTINWYDSVGELLREAEHTKPYSDIDLSDPHMGGMTIPEASRYLQTGMGDDELKAARELYDKVDASFRDRTSREWVESVAGPRLVMPEYLMGKPKCMRERKMVESSSAPIKYWIEAGVSGGTSLEATRNIAAAIAALIMRTSEERAVQLMIFSGGSRGGRKYWMPIIPVVSQPVDLTAVVGLIGTFQYNRAIDFTLIEKYTGGEPYDAIHWILGAPGQDREKRLREVFGADDRDIIIQGGYLPDEKLMTTDPVAWVHRQIQKQREII